MRIKYHKHIYKVGNKYVISKSINGNNTYYKYFDNLNDAIQYRNYLKDHNWIAPEPTHEEIEAKKTKQYYKGIYLNRLKRKYKVVNLKSKYLGVVETIEEALYYRDLFYDCPTSNIPKPDTLDLVSGNPYLIDGLMYPLPERLVKPADNSKYGKGSITKKSKSSYSVKKSATYYCSCRTYEQAYFVRRELQKCNWDKSEVPRILSEYPRWYTELVMFYRYVSRSQHAKISKWFVNVPREYCTENKIERYLYSNLEDALFERDFLVEHNWDYDLLVECIDDEENPYYEMELPPFPERKIRNVSEQKDYKNELDNVKEAILETGETQIGKLSEILGINEQNIRNWLKHYNSNYKEFLMLVLSGEDIWSILELEERIIQPNLTPSKPSNYTGYVHHNHSKRSPYCVARKGEYYGSYKTRKQARQVVKLLKQYDWDKTRLPEIQEKVGYEKFLDTKKWVYPSNQGKSYSIRKKDKTRRMINYGNYRCLKYAQKVRDLLVENDWDKSRLEEFQLEAQRLMIEEFIL